MAGVMLDDTVALTDDVGAGVEYVRDVVEGIVVEDIMFSGVVFSIVVEGTAVVVSSCVWRHSVLQSTAAE